MQSNHEIAMEILKERLEKNREELVRKRHEHFELGNEIKKLQVESERIEACIRDLDRIYGVDLKVKRSTKVFTPRELSREHVQIVVVYSSGLTVKRKVPIRYFDRFYNMKKGVPFYAADLYDDPAARGWTSEKQLVNQLLTYLVQQGKAEKIGREGAKTTYARVGDPPGEKLPDRDKIGEKMAEARRAEL